MPQPPRPGAAGGAEEAGRAPGAGRRRARLHPGAQLAAAAAAGRQAPGAPACPETHSRAGPVDGDKATSKEKPTGFFE